MHSFQKKKKKRRKEKKKKRRKITKCSKKLQSLLVVAPHKKTAHTQYPCYDSRFVY